MWALGEATLCPSILPQLDGMFLAAQINQFFFYLPYFIFFLVIKKICNVVNIIKGNEKLTCTSNLWSVGHASTTVVIQERSAFSSKPLEHH